MESQTLQEKFLPSEKPLHVRARLTMRTGGIVLLIAAAGLFLLAMEAVPGFPLREINGSTAMSRVLLVAATAASATLGGSLVIIAHRGLDELRVEPDGIVLPHRSLHDILRGRPTVVPFRAIQEGFLHRNTSGSEVITLHMKHERGKRRVLTIPIAWAREPQALVAALGKRIELKEIESWEELWFRWRSGKL